MKIAFCTPFKPLVHHRVSGDVTIAFDLFSFFQKRGHDLWMVPYVSTEWVWRKPRNWPKMFSTMHIVREELSGKNAPDLWFTYHSYYRAPDILGSLAVRNRIPYAIFAASHAKKRAANWKTKPGYYLNKQSLEQATHLFTNKHRDLEGLYQVAPKNKVTFIPPGIRTDKFTRNEATRKANRKQWGMTNKTIILTVAMLRKGTKSEGVEHVIKACSTLVAQGHDIALVIVGDGRMRRQLQTLAEELLPERNKFLGTIQSEELPCIYSSCDIFAFPGINEGLGMVYLEAQSCGLPVVAWDHDGAPQVVAHGQTGLITPSYNNELFANAISELVTSHEKRKNMGKAAEQYAKKHHTISTNYLELEEKLITIAER